MLTKATTKRSLFGSEVMKRYAVVTMLFIWLYGCGNYPAWAGAVSINGMSSNKDIYASEEVVKNFGGEIEFGFVKGQKYFVLHPFIKRNGKLIIFAPTFLVKSEYYLSYFPTPDPLKPIFNKLREQGYTVAGIDVGESWGNAAGRSYYDRLHRFLTEKYSLGHKVIIFCVSRGGLMGFNWASDNPKKVEKIVAIYPLLDLRDYVGLKIASPAYGLTEDQLKKNLSRFNPIDRLEPLANGGVKILTIHGNKDAVVPAASNSMLLEDRYRKLGGKIEAVIIDGKGHDSSSEYFQNQKIIQFVAR